MDWISLSCTECWVIKTWVDDDPDAPEDRVATPSVAEVGKILAAAASLRDACLLRLFYATGMRRNELMEARYCDIVPEEQRIFDRKGTSDKDRYVLVDALTLDRASYLAPARR